jgi:inorganic triphosphatase YgiF
MAKARDIPGLHARMPFAQAAAATVAVRAEELFEQSENVLDMDDIERVHDMRVASRRLRAVMEIYAPCFPPGEFKPLLKEVKALADALGARRDPDVLLAQLAKLEDSLPKANAPGVDAFAAPIHAEQQQGNEVLAAALDQAEHTDLRGRLQLLAASAAAAEDAGDAEDFRGSPPAPPDAAPPDPAGEAVAAAIAADPEPAPAAVVDPDDLAVHANGDGHGADDPGEDGPDAGGAAA